MLVRLRGYLGVEPSWQAACDRWPPGRRLLGHGRSRSVPNCNQKLIKTQSKIDSKSNDFINQLLFNFRLIWGAKIYPKIHLKGIEKYHAFLDRFLDTTWSILDRFWDPKSTRNRPQNRPKRSLEGHRLPDGSNMPRGRHPDAPGDLKMVPWTSKMCAMNLKSIENLKILALYFL